MTTLDSEEVILEGVLEQKGVLLEGGVGEGESAGLLGPDTEASERGGVREGEYTQGNAVWVYMCVHTDNHLLTETSISGRAIICVVN